jgi:hypothetical protein
MFTSETKARLKHKLWQETNKMLWLSLYLFAFLAALAAYRSILLGEGGAGAWPLFNCAVEALVLAKVMLIGNALKLGERFFQRRMFARTLSRAFTFTIFALTYSALEKLVTRMIRGNAFAEVWQDLANMGPKPILVRAVVLFIFFVPLFALWEIGRVLGEGKLHSMFFDLPAKRSE